MSYAEVRKEIQSVTLSGRGKTKETEFSVTVTENNYLKLSMKDGTKVSGTVAFLTDDMMCIMQDDGRPVVCEYRNVEWCGYPQETKPSIIQRLSAVTGRLIKTSKIKLQVQLDAYVAGYLQGISDQQTIDWYNLEAGLVKEVKRVFELLLCKPFYFILDQEETGYVVVMAEDTNAAVQKFKKTYKSKKISYKYIVNDIAWKREQKKYGDTPVEILK